MKFLLCVSVLVLQASLFELKFPTHGVRSQPGKRRRFKDVLQEAKKSAVADYVDEYLKRVLGTRKRGNDENEKDKDFMNLLQDFEMLMYSRKLHALFKQRSGCFDWYCFGERGTETTTKGETTGTEPSYKKRAVHTTTPATFTLLTTQTTT